MSHFTSTEHCYTCEMHLLRFDRLIERGRWDNTLNRGCEPGDPKLLYNLGGRRGEWSAVSIRFPTISSTATNTQLKDDSEIWRAIQPSLRLVSKILNTNHPAWLASLNPYHLRPVPSHLDPRTEEDRALSEIPTLVSIWKELDESKMYPDAKILMQNGFDILKASAAVLKDRIIWSFASSFREDGKILRDQQWSGLTHHPNEEGQIKIFVSCELIWPLLVPDYTLSEKASCAYLLAVSMLHELSVGYPSFFQNPASFDSFAPVANLDVAARCTNSPRIFVNTISSPFHSSHHKGCISGRSVEP